MKEIKVTLALLLIINLNLSAQNFKVDNIYYRIHDGEKKTVYVTYEGKHSLPYNNSKGDIVIPDSVIYKNTYYTVIGIDVLAYRDSEITSISIPPSVMEIRNEAFYSCDSLKSIIFKDSKTPIALHSPSSSYGSFNNCKNIRSVYIGRNLKSDYKNYPIAMSLSDSDSIKSIVFGNLVDTIPDYLCSGCMTEEKIKIPNSIKYIGEWAFSNANITDTLDLSNITYLGDFAFRYSSQNLKCVIFGEALEPIYNNGIFYGCSNIESVYMLKSKAVTCNEHLFDEDVYNNATLYVPKGRIQAFSRTTPWNKFYIEELKSFNVTFVIDNKVYEKISVDYGKEIILPEPPVKEGHTFNGWENIPTTMPAEDITITGSFTKNKYKITYTVDGNIFASDSIEYGSQISQTTTPTKEGYTFCGWSEIPDTMPAEDITITGSFEVNSYKAFFLVGNSVYAILSFNYGETITPPINPQKDGYTFNNWTNLPENMPAEDIVLIANFTENTENTGVYDIYENSIDNLYYDLRGNRIKKTATGIYIINGKKIFVK